MKNKGQKNIIMELLFPHNDDISIYDKLLIDDESVTHITIPNDALIITNLIDKHCKQLNINPSEQIITDITAGVGGNIFSFSKTFKLVNAIEINTLRYKYLHNNIDIYKLNNIKCYNDDCLNLIYNLKTDIIFMDPPWGGNNYKNEYKLRLKISNENIEDICKKIIIRGIKIIVIKLPKNYDLQYLYQLETPLIKIFNYKLIKMTIIIIINYIFL